MGSISQKRASFKGSLLRSKEKRTIWGAYTKQFENPLTTSLLDVFFHYMMQTKYVLFLEFRMSFTP